MHVADPAAPCPSTVTILYARQRCTVISSTRHFIRPTDAGLLLLDMFRLNPLRTSSPDIMTLDQPPPNPYADEKIPGEADVFRKLLKQRLRIDEEEVEEGMGVDEAAGE